MINRLFIILLFCSGALSANVDRQFYDLLSDISTLKPAEQIERLTPFLHANPDLWPAYLKISNLYRNTEHPGDFISFFNNLTQHSDTALYSQLILARYYYKKKDFTKASNHFLAALDINPNDYKVLAEYASFYRFIPELKDQIYKQNSPSIHPFIDGMSYYMQGEYIKAIPSLEQQLAICPHNNNLRFRIVYAYLELNQLTRVDTLIQTGLQLSLCNHDQYNIIDFTYLSAILAEKQNNFSKAKEHYHQSAKLAREIENTYDIAKMHYKLGSLYLKKGHADSASKYFEKAMSIHELTNSSNSYEYAVKIGYEFHNHHFYSLALKYYNRAKNSMNNNTDLNNELWLNSLLYSLYKDFNIPSLAEKLLDENEKKAKQNNLELRLNYTKLQKYKNLINKNKDLSIIGTKLYELIDFFHPQDPNDVLNCYEALANIEKLKQNYNGALSIYRKALDYTSQMHLSNKGARYPKKIATMLNKLCQYKKALTELDSALVNAPLADDPYTFRMIYGQYGLAYEGLDDLNNAFLSYKQAINYSEQLRSSLSSEDFRIDTADNYAYIWQGLTRCYYKQYQSDNNPDYLDSLLYYEERYHGRALKDRLDKRNQLAQGANPNPAYRAAEYEMSSTQAALRREAGTQRSPEQWDLLTAEIQAAKYSMIEQRLFTQDSLLDVSPLPPSQMNIRTLQSRLQRDNSGILLYHLDDHTSFVLVVTPDTALTVALQVNPDSLNNKINQLMQPLYKLDDTNPANTPFHANLAHQLYQMVFGPIEKAGTLPRQLLIIQDGHMAAMPFEMLLDQAPEKAVYTPQDAPTYADAFLVNRYAFYYSPTMRELKPQKTKWFSSSNILVFANPFANKDEMMDRELQFRHRTGWRFDPLPFAQVEAGELGKITSRTKIFERNQASETALKSLIQDYDIVHLATHAFVDTTFDDFSGLVLAAGEDSTTDGILMGYEIGEMDLDCDLVTLSACETGRGKRVQAEGILGMPRLFLGAGARSVLMSHWKVDDRFTSLLMPQFYRNYLQGNQSKADALAAAKRVLLQRGPTNNLTFYQHPLYWAAFTLYGDPGKAPAPVLPLSGLLFAMGLVLAVVIVGGGGYTLHRKRKQR